MGVVSTEHRGTENPLIHIQRAILSCRAGRGVRWPPALWQGRAASPALEPGGSAPGCSPGGSPRVCVRESLGVTVCMHGKSESGGKSHGVETFLLKARPAQMPERRGRASSSAGPVGRTRIPCMSASVTLTRGPGPSVLVPGYGLALKRWDRWMGFSEDKHPPLDTTPSLGAPTVGGCWKKSSPPPRPQGPSNTGWERSGEPVSHTADPVTGFM